MDISNLPLSELIDLNTQIRRTLKGVHGWFDTARPNWDEYFSMIALAVSTRGSCCRRRVGCVLVSSSKDIIGTGYNGKGAGLVNCLDQPCASASMGAGAGIDACEAIHAEVNALIRCSNRKEIETVYVTCSPCSNCVDVLLGTSATRIVFTEEYANSQESKRRWEQAGREWVKLDIEQSVQDDKKVRRMGDFYRENLCDGEKKCKGSCGRCECEKSSKSLTLNVPAGLDWSDLKKEIEKMVVSVEKDYGTGEDLSGIVASAFTAQQMQEITELTFNERVKEDRTGLVWGKMPEVMRNLSVGMTEKILEEPTSLLVWDDATVDNAVQVRKRIIKAAKAVREKSILANSCI